MPLPPTTRELEFNAIMKIFDSLQALLLATLSNSTEKKHELESIVIPATIHTR